MISLSINPAYWFQLYLQYNQLISVYVPEEENSGGVCSVDMNISFFFFYYTKDKSAVIK